MSEVVRYIFSSRSIYLGLNSNSLILFPKVENVDHIESYSPIALVTFYTKLLQQLSQTVLLKLLMVLLLPSFNKGC